VHATTPAARSSVSCIGSRHPVQLFHGSGLILVAAAALWMSSRCIDTRMPAEINCDKTLSSNDAIVALTGSYFGYSEISITSMQYKPKMAAQLRLDHNKSSGGE